MKSNAAYGYPSAPLLIALVGADGAGKSTVAKHLVRWLGQFGPAEQVHLGKQAGNMGRALAGAPVIGGLVGRFLRKKSDGVKGRIKAHRQPTLVPALIITAFSLRRLRRFRRMLSMRRRGTAIVTDRFPQIGTPNAFDGPGFPFDAQGSWVVTQLARFEHAAFQRMVRHTPDLVVRLHVSLDVAVARKPDHRREALARKIAILPGLAFGLAKVVEIDADAPLPDVLAAVERAAGELMMSRAV
ncbi:hypothetical protein KPL74_08580 [Bacillus sp. NP157]|nr:hypothetical protein KPL74_08580 [Bacillus sp. NP157]